MTIGGATVMPDLLLEIFLFTTLTGGDDIGSHSETIRVGECIAETLGYSIESGGSVIIDAFNSSVISLHRHTRLCGFLVWCLCLGIYLLFERFLRFVTIGL